MYNRDSAYTAANPSMRVSKCQKKSLDRIDGILTFLFDFIRNLEICVQIQIAEEFCYLYFTI